MKMIFSCSDTLQLLTADLNGSRNYDAGVMIQSGGSQLIVYTTLSLFIKFISSLSSCTGQKTGYLTGLMLAHLEVTRRHPSYLCFPFTDLFIYFAQLLAM